MTIDPLLFAIVIPRVAPAVLTIALGLLAAIAVLAVISPRWFERIAIVSSQWIDTDHVLKRLDTTIDVDRYFLPYVRHLGGAVLLAVGTLAYIFVRYFWSD